MSTIQALLASGLEALPNPVAPNPPITPPPDKPKAMRSLATTLSAFLVPFSVGTPPSPADAVPGQLCLDPAGADGGALYVFSTGAWRSLGSWSGGTSAITLTGDVTGAGTGSVLTAIGAGKVTNTMLAGGIDLANKVSGVLGVVNGGTGNATGNAATVTNGVYTSGSYSDPSWLTSLSGSKVSGNIAGQAGSVANGVYTSGSYADPAWITSLAGSKVTNAVLTSGSYADPSWITSLSGSKVSGNIAGQAGSVANGVYTSGSYADPTWLTSLSGSKVSGSIAGQAGSVVNGVYTTGSYADPSWITSLSGSKVSGNIAGQAGSVANGVYTSGSYADPAWITSLAGSKVSGSIAGQAGSVANGVYTTGSYADPSWITSLAGNKVSHAVTTQTVNYAILGADEVILANGAITVTLPTAVGVSGKWYTIKRINASGTVVIATTSSQTIDGMTTVSIADQYAAMSVVSNGANWLIV